MLPLNFQGWFPFVLTGLISLLSKGLSRASLHLLIPNSWSFPPPAPWQTQVCFLCLWVCFCFVYMFIWMNTYKWYHKLDSTYKWLFIAVVQSLCHVQHFVTSWTAAFQASLSFTISQSLLKFMFTELVMLSSIWCLSFSFWLTLLIFEEGYFCLLASGYGRKICIDYDWVRFIAIHM